MDVLSIDNAFQTEPKLSFCSSQWLFICFHVQNLDLPFAEQLQNYGLSDTKGALIDTECITHTCDWTAQPDILHNLISCSVDHYGIWNQWWALFTNKTKLTNKNKASVSITEFDNAKLKIYA